MKILAASRTYAIVHRVSWNQVGESVADLDKVGRPGMYIVVIRPNSACQLTYLLLDKKGTDASSCVEVLVGKANSQYSVFLDANGEMLHQTVSLHPKNNKKSWYVYDDMNGDGKLDTMNEMHAELGGVKVVAAHRWILLSGRWVEAEVEGVKGNSRVYVQDGTRGRREAVFDDAGGDWVLVP